jgi:hypothetical protein
MIQIKTLEERVEQLLACRDFEDILYENEMTLTEALLILIKFGYIEFTENEPL